jgi:type III restriction enzyme
VSFEVATPIINSPFREPAEHWRIRQGETPVRAPGRRPSVVFQPPEQRDEWDLSDGTLRKAPGAEEGAYAGRTYEMLLVNRVRERVMGWRDAGFPGASRTTRDLLDWWQRDGEEHPLFFAQIEAATTIIFLKEARADFLQGVVVPLEALSDDQQTSGARAFQRYACKMATGSGKTTVMGMLVAWSILNKLANRTSRVHSDSVVVICPNVTIRDRLRELDPAAGDASIYRTRRLVPPELMPQLARGRVFVTNWHVLEPQSTQQGGSRVVRTGVPVDTTETVVIGDRNTTARGSRYMTRASYEALVASGEVFVKSEELDGDGLVKKATIHSRRWVESDSALIERVLGREIGKKENLLVFNDEAHHAYRIRQGSDAESDSEALTGTAEDDDELAREATVWVEGLDKIQAQRGINFCVDLSATPYFLARAGRDTARPFPWTVSDFGLIDAIESGLVKIPQLPSHDTTGADRSPYFNIWEWVKSKLTPAERGGRSGGGFKPEAVLKYAYQPIAMLAGDWRAELERWRNEHQDARPPVMIIVCRDTRLAKVIHDWVAEDVCPEGIPALGVFELRNTLDARNTIRVDSKVIAETDSSGADEGRGAKGDESRWMRFTLDTVGKLGWPQDSQERAVYPPGFEELAKKLGRPLTPPGKDVRCIVSVGMLTEGWDANTVTHIIGLRPFMSQLLCEQVVGRGLRRASYEVDAEGLFTEEVAQVFGVPFEVIPFKATGEAPAPKAKRFHVHALPERKEFEIRFPRVIGYTQAVRNRVTVDWSHVPRLVLTPGELPTTVDVGALAQTDTGRITTTRFGAVREITLEPFRSGVRVQQGAFRMARDLTQQYLGVAETKLPAHVLFPQVLAIVERFVRERVVVPSASDIRDLFAAPYYGWALEILRDQVQPDTSAGEAPELPRYAQPPTGSTAAVDFWTSRPTHEVAHSHVNYVVADTARWEQQAAFYIDKHKAVAAFVKNSGLGLTIPYLYNGQPHDFTPDFLIRLKVGTERYLVLETKGFDPLAEVKAAAAHRWANALNADGRHGNWSFAMARSVSDVSYLLSEAGRSEDAVQDAADFGVDVDQLRASLERTPDERLRELEANAPFLGELQSRAAERMRRGTR